jgi:hypothetical protein
MRTRLWWTLGCVVLFGGILTVPRSPWPAAAWAYGTAYFLLGVSLLGAVARWWVRGSPALWRPLMLSLGSLAAAIEIWLEPATGLAVRPVDQWMVALLGLLAVAVTARLVPDRIGYLWFGVDRRVHDQGA